MRIVDEVFMKVLCQENLCVRDLEQVKKNYQTIHNMIRNYRFSEYENWGIRHQPNINVFEVPRLGDVSQNSFLDGYLCKYNWRYSSFSQLEKETFFDRLYSINFDVLLDLVQKFVYEKFGDYKLGGLSIFGGVLYGHENQVPDDIDLIVLLEKANFTANPVSMYIPNMEKDVFCPNAPRPVKSGKAGLTLVGTQTINPLSQDEVVKQFSLVYWGESVPIYGDAFCNIAPPPLAHLPHPYRLMAWAYKDLLMNQTDVSCIIRSLSRVIVGIYIALLVIERLHLDSEIIMLPQDIWNSIYADPQPERLIDLYVWYSRELSQNLYRLECIVKEKILEKLEQVYNEYHTGN